MSREPSTLYLDIVDYPGEWLLDLPLLELSYAEWSEQVRRQLAAPALQRLAEPWLSLGAGLDASQPFEDGMAAELASRYTRYLHQCKEQLVITSYSIHYTKLYDSRAQPIRHNT